MRLALAQTLVVNIEDELVLMGKFYKYLNWFNKFLYIIFFIEFN